VSDIFDRYFSFSDAAVSDQEAFASLIGLFAVNAEIYPASYFSFSESDAIKGISEIQAFFEAILSRSLLLRHVWTPPKTDTDNEGRVSVGWAVAGLRKAGEVFCTRGVDTVELDERGKIKRLTIERP
jgi:hypothetical protein